MAQLGDLIVTGVARFLNKIHADITGDAGSVGGHETPTSGNASATQVVLGDDTRLTDSRTPASHTHGNIQNGGTLQSSDITIASGDKLVVTDSSDSNKVARSSITFDASTETECLTKKGTWKAFTNNSGTITQVKTTAGTHSTVSVTSGAANFNVPTKTSHLTNDSGFVTSDTKNTAGSTNNDNTLYLIGATTQTASTQTYSNSNVYATNGNFHSKSISIIDSIDIYGYPSVTSNPSTYGHCKFYSGLGWEPEDITYLGVNGAGILGIGDGDSDDDVYPPNDSKTTPAQGFRYIANFSANPVDKQILIADGTNGKIKPSGIIIGTDTTRYLRNDGSWVIPPDTYDKIKYRTIKCGTTAIASGKIIVADSNGLYKHLTAGTAFDITYPILAAGSSISANETSDNVYLAISLAIAGTQSITLTAYQPVYIKGTLNGTSFTPISTTPLTQTIPSSYDGYQYMLLGIAHSTTIIFLIPDHDIYAHHCGAFRQLNANIVCQGNTSSAKWRNILMGWKEYNNFGDTPVDAAAATHVNGNLSFQPSTGTLRTSNMISNTYQIGVNQAIMQYNSTLEAIEFVFS